ncbi:MAG TPA: hypothetical protein VGJ33_00515 [Candidatus Angelobacter sp.]
MFRRHRKTESYFRVLDVCDRIVVSPQLMPGNQECIRALVTACMNAHQFRFDHNGVDTIASDRADRFQPGEGIAPRIDETAIRSDLRCSSTRFPPTQDVLLCPLPVLDGDGGLTVDARLPQSAYNLHG